MSVVGLITEYNPFHLGHRYHIAEAKRLTGADTAIVIMSGNYVQRGEPSFVDKYTKTKIALNNGADMVIELPCCFACASAEYFAYAAVSVLDRLGIVDFICFGTENNDINTLSSIAEILADEPKAYRSFLNEELKKGSSYAHARETALARYINLCNGNGCHSCDMSAEHYSDNSISDYAGYIDEKIAVLKDCVVSDILSAPNNILAIEYLKALSKRKSSIKPVALKRVNASYHDSEKDKCFYSATALRKLVDYSYDELKAALDKIDNNYSSAFMKSFPVFWNDFSAMLGYSLHTHICDNTLNSIFGMTTQLSNRVRNNIDDFMTADSFTDMLKTKDISYTAVSRALLHCMLNIYTDDINEYLDNDICSFVRVLGFSKSQDKMFKAIKATSDMRIITRLADLESSTELNPLDKRLIKSGIYCDNLYRMICRQKYNSMLPTEYTAFMQKI